MRCPLCRKEYVNEAGVEHCAWTHKQVVHFANTQDQQRGMTHCYLSLDAVPTTGNYGAVTCTDCRNNAYFNVMDAVYRSERVPWWMDLGGLIVIAVFVIGLFITTR